MDITIVLYIVAAFAIGVILAFFLKKGSKKNSDLIVNYETRISELEDKNEKLKSQLSDAEEQAKENYSPLAQKNKELKSKYENLLKEANAQCEKLDKQLKRALEGALDDSIKEQLAETEKLKKKIKDLEDEIEGNEDDISDLEKKIKSKDSEMGELQEGLEKEKKVAKQLQKELSSTQQQLEEKVKELELKMGSLDFIQEILSAKELSMVNIKNLYKKIDFFESFIKGQFTDLNAHLYTTYNFPWSEAVGKQGFEIKKKYFYDGFDQWASTKRKDWLDGKTTIAFVGEFSAGKTSIVNRILSQDNPDIPQLPVSTKATTAIPTYIAGGPNVSYSFISGDEKRKAILEETFKKVSKDVLNQIKGVSSLIKYFVMTYKNPNLNGLSILDTPGFSSNDREDGERTIEVINECDALFWVFDVQNGDINRSSTSVLNILKKKLNKPLYIVINKVDTKPTSEVQKVENKIKETLAKEGLSVQQFIRFSGKSPLSTIMDPIKGVKKVATRDTFIGSVQSDLEDLLKRLNGRVKSCNSNYDAAHQEGENLTEEFIEHMRALKSDCETAQAIPQWVEHFFSKDRFEMSASEGAQLQDLLDRIANDRIQDLAEKFHERVEKAAEIQQKWLELCNIKAAWQKTQECFEYFKKISKEL